MTEFWDAEEDVNEEEEERINQLYLTLFDEYKKELSEAVKEAKEHNERRYNHSGAPPIPLWENGRVIAIFREYWLKCDEMNQTTGGYYNPKWIVHEDLEGELKEIIDDMPYYPIGIKKEGGYC